MLVKLLEGSILIILTSDVCADAGELLKLLFNLFGGSLDERLDSPKVFGVVHLSSSIANDLDVLWEELVAELMEVSEDALVDDGLLTKPKRAGKVFFFARSPEAPSTTMTVFSFSSMVLLGVSCVY